MASRSPWDSASTASSDAFQVKLYEVATGRETVTFPGPKGGVNDLAFHPDGRHLAVAGSEVVEVWDVVARTKVHELRGHSKWVYGVAYQPRREMAGHRRLGPHDQAPGRGHRRGAADDLRP